MKYFLYRFSWVWIITIAGFGLIVQANEISEHRLELTIRCTKNNIKVGDEIPIVFTIINKGKSAYSYDQREYDRSGRFREYQLNAREENGTVVPDPRENYVEGLGGGLSSGRGMIRTGESFTKTIALNRWALINRLAFIL